jgi:hypothetical protein
MEHNGRFEVTEDVDELGKLHGTEELCQECTRRLQCISQPSSECKNKADELIYQWEMEDQQI